MQSIGPSKNPPFGHKPRHTLQYRRGASRVFVVILIGTLATVAVIYYRRTQLDDQALTAAARPLDQAELKAKHIEPPPSPSEFQTRLSIISGGQGEATRPIVSLAKPKGPQTHMDVKLSDQALIGRELIRQAFLIAARDELGLTTRDEVLDDITPAEGTIAGIVLSSNFIQRGTNRAYVRRFDSQGKVVETILRQDLTTSSPKTKLLTAILPDAESMSRTEFPKILKELGLQGEPNKVRSGAPVPDGVEDRLTRLGFIENYSAIRDLHAVIRADGESAVRLSALARGYAQLGILTEFHWHPAHKAFKARALLYSQRLIARDPKSPDGLRTRAFVRAVIGIPQRALDDLAEASKLAEANKPATPAPAWQRVIESYAKSDLKELKSIDGPYSRLAAFLRLFAIEFPAGNSRTFGAAKDVINVDPECYRAFDAISKNCGISLLHYSTVASPAYFSQSLPDKLKSLQGLPEEVKAPLDRFSKTITMLRNRRQAPVQDDDKADVEKDAIPSNSVSDELAVVDAISTAGKSSKDTGEPSWGVLAHLIRETRFVQVWRRLHFMVAGWSVPVEEYWAAAQPLVEHHRYRPYLELYGQPGPAGQNAFARFAQHVDAAELEHSEAQMVRDLERFAPQKMVGIWNVVFSHDDDVVSDLSEQAWPDNGQYSLAIARFLLEVDPRSAFAMSILVNRDWNTVQDKVDEWRKLTNDSPTLLAAIGQEYLKLKRFDDARTVLRSYLKQTPDLWGYESLASSYEAQGNLDGWRKTLKEYLDSSTEDRGLDHARIQVKLADDLMSQGKWAEARPYAEAAAETWAGWAMQCAARCAEGMEDWDTAETWYQRGVERYPSTDWPNLYLFRKRTRHGNLEEAQQEAETYLTRFRNRPDLVNLGAAAHFYWLSGNLKKALDTFDQDYQNQPTLATAFCRALIADELKEIVRRDASFDEGSQLPQEQGPKSLQIFKRLQKDLASDGKAPGLIAELDQILESIPADNRAITQFYVGRYFLNRQKPDLAAKYLKPCIKAKSVTEWVRLLSADGLRSISTDASK